MSAPRLSPRIIFLALVAWALPLAWITAIPGITLGSDPELETRKRLLQNEKLIEHFVREYGEVPSSLTDLMIFAKGTNRTFDSHDGFGERFDYLRLDRDHYTLRSFGKDGVQNTLLTKADEAIFKSGKIPPRAITYNYTRQLTPHWFPAALLLGCDAPNHTWYSRLFIDAAAGTRRLLVRHHKHTDLHMFAPHDSVEEFLWLPDGHRIVFTASGSRRYRDGVYLWDILSDEITNLYEIATAQPGFVAGDERQEHLAFALAGVYLEPTADRATVMIYAGQRAGGTIDPSSFFSAPNLLLFAVGPSPTKPLLLSLNELEAARVGTPVTHDLVLGQHIQAVDQASKTQAGWMRLPLSGDFGKLLEDWQSYTEKQAGSPLFPYGLWYLAALYGEIYGLSQLKAPADRTTEVLRSFGAELAQAAAKEPLAPTYIRGLAAHAAAELLRGTKTPYSFINGGSEIPWKKPILKHTQ